MSEFHAKDSLGNQGWWAIVAYLIRIGDWPSVISFMRPSMYRECQKKYHETHPKATVSQAINKESSE